MSNQEEVRLNIFDFKILRNKRRLICDLIVFWNLLKTYGCQSELV